MVEEPAVFALEAFRARNYSKCGEQLNKLEGVIGPNRTVALNKSLADFCASNMRNTEQYRVSLCQQLGQVWPNANLKEIKTKDDTIPFYNYATLLFHKRYYAQANAILEKLFQMLRSDVSDGDMLRRITLFLFEVYLWRRMPEKVLALSEIMISEFEGKNEREWDMLNRLIFRANMMLKKQVQQVGEVNSMLWLFLKAHQQHIAGDFKGALETLSRYSEFLEQYGKPDELWAPLNNNLGVIHLSMRKCHLAIKYIQQAIKERCRNPNGNIISNPIDRPIHVYNLGVALLYADRTDDAFECLVEAARHFPDNARLWTRLAECCVARDERRREREPGARRLGAGADAKIAVARADADARAAAGESFAIPTPTLEFAALCLRNALALLREGGGEGEEAGGAEGGACAAAPLPPLEAARARRLRGAALLASALVLLRLGDPAAALAAARRLLAREGCGSRGRALAHAFAAEALAALERPREALAHLNPAAMPELCGGARGAQADALAAAVWLNGAVCRLLLGETAAARAVLQQLGSPRALRLQLYLEICAGNVDNCHALLRKLKLYPS